MKKTNMKNLLTNVAAIAVVVGTAIKSSVEAMNGDDIDWTSIGLAVAVAVIGWASGKTKTLKTE